jgi:hypothetical protein
MDQENQETFEDWPFSSGSGSVPVPQHSYPTPLPFSTIQTQPFSPHIAQPASASTPKVAIPRLAGSDPFTPGRRRSARACEPCRQRKIKCDGIRPSCGQCAYHNHSCSYEDVKRVRDQKLLGSLIKRVDTYEALLRELETEVDLPTARKIKKALKVSPVNVK